MLYCRHLCFICSVDWAVVMRDSGKPFVMPAKSAAGQIRKRAVFVKGRMHDLHRPDKKSYADRL